MKKIVALLAGLMMMTATSAMALTLTLSDGLNSVSVNDGGVGDVNSLDGMVTYSGGIGNWIANVSTGTSSPIIGSDTFPILDLNSVDVSSAAGGNLTITLFDTYSDYTALSSIISGFTTSIGGTSVGQVSLAAYINGVQIADISWDDMLKTGSAFSGSEGYIGIPIGNEDPFDMTLVASITHTTSGSTSFDAELKPVPEPGTMVLLGAGILGLGIYGRRRAKK